MLHIFDGNALEINGRKRFGSVSHQSWIIQVGSPDGIRKSRMRIERTFSSGVITEAIFCCNFLVLCNASWRSWSSSSFISIFIESVSMHAGAESTNHTCQNTRVMGKKRENENEDWKVKLITRQTVDIHQIVFVVRLVLYFHFNCDGRSGWLRFATVYFAYIIRGFGLHRRQ